MRRVPHQMGPGVNSWGGRAVALLERERDQTVQAWIDGRWKSDEEIDLKRAVAAIDALITRIQRGELPPRPRRQMPTLRKIGRHHGIPHDICSRCRFAPEDDDHGPSFWLQRAHIIDRHYGGLDIPANLAPLCSVCHALQPSFQPGDEARALTWFRLPAPEGM